MVGLPSDFLLDDGFLLRTGGKLDKEMRFIFVVIGIFILAGILCVVFAVTQDIR